MSQVSHPVSGTEGNTNSSVLSRNRGRRWSFTINNYTEEICVSLSQYFLGNPKVKYIIGKEVGEEKNTPHLQGYIEFVNQICFTTIKKLMPKAHIEKAKGSQKENYIYCSKEGNFETNIILEKELEIKYKEYMEEKYKEIKWYPWQEEILKILKEEPSERKVFWYWEEVGNRGKSFLVKYIDWIYNSIVANGKQADVFNQYKTYLENEKKYPTVAIIDIPRSHKDFICYSTLEKIKDGLIYSGKYEGGKLRLLPHHLIIFANFEPDKNMLSEDRWCIREI